MKKLSREEATKVLEGMKVKIEIPKAAVTQWERNAALDMAIEVLSCSEIPNKSDTISRQAAIDALDVLCQEHRYKIPGKRETYSQYNEAWQDALDRAEGAIFNLPAVQPDHTADVSKKVKRTDETAQNVSDSDLVSREAAIEALARMMPRSYTPDGSHPADEEIFMAQEIYADCIKAIEILPIVQPERVWHSCKTPPKHHKDVLVRGTEAIGNVTVYKVMQWDVDAWRPTDYAPSIIWEEWSEIYE